MMLARVADSLYWIGRYVERAEHLSRLALVMLNATLDRAEAADQAADIARGAVGRAIPGGDTPPIETARALVLDREGESSVAVSLFRARENARQVRDQITSEMWESLNRLYLDATSPDAERAFYQRAPTFLASAIADLHLFRGATDATMSHGEGRRFMMTGLYLERAQLMARLLKAGLHDHALTADDHAAMVSLLRMACALEPYLREYTAEVTPQAVLRFLMFDQSFPRSIRFATARMEEHLGALSQGREMGRDAGRVDPARIAGRLNARLAFADIDDGSEDGAKALIESVGADCRAIDKAVHETFVAYPLELRLPA